MHVEKAQAKSPPIIQVLSFRARCCRQFSGLSSDRPLMDLDTLKSRKCYVPCKIRPLTAYPRLVHFANLFNLINSTTFILFSKYYLIVDQLGLKDSSRDFQLNCVISYFFYLHLILHVCVKDLM